MSDAVKRSAPEPCRLDPGELVHAVEHFFRGLVGEGEEKDFAGTHALGKQVRDPVGEGARFAGARAGKDEQRTGLRGDGRELLVVELRAEVDRWETGRSGGWVQGEIHEE